MKGPRAANITRLQRELRDERDFFSAVMENLSALVLIMSADRVVERVNRTCLQACGKTVSELVGKPLASILPELDACLSQAPPPFECEIEWDGLVVAWRSSNVGERLICTGHDVTERRRVHRQLERQNQKLEEAQRQAEAGSRAKTDFLAMMSHELRTPMSAVLGMLELLAESPLEERQKDYVRLADTGARELLGVLDDILDISKIEAGHIQIRPRPFSLPHGLQRLVEVLQLEARRNQCRLHFDYPESLPETVVGDWGRLRQVLLNLLGNALKFCDDDCGLRVRPVDGATHTFEFAVWDTGDGIAEADQQRVFEPFVQVDGSLSRSHEGTGLGLAISAQLVERMGGELKLESQPGQGSTFRFQLKLPPGDAEPFSDEPGQGPRGLRLLLVDDNPISRRVAGLMLEQWGYQVESVDSGQQALRRLQETSYDLVLLDIQMPGMSGYKAFKMLRQQEEREGRRPVPVVALTAHCVVGERERALRAGMDGFLTKPVERAALSQTLARLFPEACPESTAQGVEPRL